MLTKGRSKMRHNELRKDYLLNRWVVIATERARRPSDFAKPKSETPKTATCPLCVGNEHMTPPATLVYLPEDGGIRKDKEEGNFRSKNWLIRSIPNMFPAFSQPQNPADSAPVSGNNFGYAFGHHEVIVESPVHDEHPPAAPLSQLKLLVEAYRDRLDEFAMQPYVGYVQIFRNHGLEAGASLSHAHSQIIATPFVPSIPAEEITAAKTYHALHGSCVFCDLIKSESQTPRIISEDGFFSVFTPYASVNPMEFWIVPKWHAPNILSLTSGELEAFARTLKTTLGALKTLVNDPPYNYGIHQSITRDASGFYHWHLEVYPHMATWAGFEKATGMYINTITPETAAEELRKAIQQG
jgi:UDPglucose--hexose-1-phosphate uridylyltransferase